MTARDRRVLRVGALVALLAVLLLRILPAGYRAFEEARERVRDKMETAERSRRLIAEGRATRDTLQFALARFVALAPRLLAGRSHAEASATLVSWVSGSANRAGLRVRRAESVPDSSGGSLRPVEVRVELEGDVAGITQFLKDAETGLPVLSVPALAITAVNAPERNAGSETLRFEITISGWHLGEVGDQ